MEAKAIAKEILYKPVTNGKSEKSILEGEKLILEYTQQLQTELKEAKQMIDTLNKELKQRIETDNNF